MENCICCVKQKQNIYQKICAYASTNLYFFYCILGLLLAGCCFMPGFAYATIAYLFVLAIFLSIEQIMGLAVFLYLFIIPFRGLANGLDLEYLPIGILCCVSGIKTIVNLVIAKKWPNLLLVGALVLFLIYIALPVHKTDISFFSKYLIGAGLVFTVYHNRKEISFEKLVIYFCVGIIFSCMLATLKPISPRLQDLMIEYNAPNITARFQGFRQHPNNLAIRCEFALVCLFVVKLRDKIKTPEFLYLFFGVLAYGLLTFSRNFIFASLISIPLFLILYGIRYKVKSLPVVITIVVLIAACLLVPYKQTKEYMSRMFQAFNDMEYKESIIRKGDPRYSDEWWQLVMNGEVRYDPGRKEIARNYINDWKSSTTTILFGRGSATKRIGKLHAHNMWIQELWFHGIFGYVLYAAIVCAMINYKKLKQIKLSHILSICLFLLPMTFMSLLEPLTLDFSFYIIAIVFFSELANEQKNHINGSKECFCFNNTQKSNIIKDNKKEA